MNKFTLFFVMAIFIATGCSNTTVKTAKGKSGAEAMIMESLYGNFDGKVSTLLPDSKAAKTYQTFRPGLYVLPGDEVICKPDQWLELGQSSALIITSCNSSIGSDCPACAPVMGIGFVVKNKSGNWEKTEARPFVMSLGGNGRLPEAKQVQVGKNNWVIVFDSIKHLPGSMETERTLFSANHEFKNVLSYTISGTNMGNCGPRTDIPCYNFETTFKTDPTSEGMGPVKMHKTGTEPIKNNPKLILPVDRYMKFCFNGDRYQRPCPN